eukprot:5595330-Prymnesium_polylepis.1
MVKRVSLLLPEASVPWVVCRDIVVDAPKRLLLQVGVVVRCLGCCFPRRRLLVLAHERVRAADQLTADGHGGQVKLYRCGKGAGARCIARPLRISDCRFLRRILLSTVGNTR